MVKTVVAEFSHINLLNERKLEPKYWFNQLRMNEGTYILSTIVIPHIKSQDTGIRKAVTLHERLSVFLAMRRSCEDVKYSCAISHFFTTVSLFACGSTSFSLLIRMSYAGFFFFCLFE